MLCLCFMKNKNLVATNRRIRPSKNALTWKLSLLDKAEGEEIMFCLFCFWEMSGNNFQCRIFEALQLRKRLWPPAYHPIFIYVLFQIRALVNLVYESNWNNKSSCKYQNYCKMVETLYKSFRTADLEIFHMDKRVLPSKLAGTSVGS